MKDYFYGKFPEHLQLLKLRRPNVIVREGMRDEEVVFVGGRDWEGVQSDLQPIPPEYREKFIVSLLMVVLTDQCLYTHQRDAYPVWREKTNFPKFGWTGFGPHNENPLKILWAPERDAAVDIDVLLDLMPEFVRFFCTETEAFFGDHLPEVSIADYFESMVGDVAFEFDQGQAVVRFKNGLKPVLDGEGN